MFRVKIIVHYESDVIFFLDNRIKIMFIIEEVKIIKKCLMNNAAAVKIIKPLSAYLYGINKLYLVIKTRRKVNV